MRAPKEMTDAQRKRRPCAACGKPVGLATIVAGGDYPNASLCLECGTRRTVEEVFEMIQKRRATRTHAREGDEDE